MYEKFKMVDKPRPLDFSSWLNLVSKNLKLFKKGIIPAVFNKYDIYFIREEENKVLKLRSKIPL